MPARQTREHSPDTSRSRVLIRSLDEIPAFADECDEVAFWDTHEMSGELMESLPELPADELARLDQIRAKRQRRRATG